LCSSNSEQRWNTNGWPFSPTISLYLSCGMQLYVFIQENEYGFINIIRAHSYAHLHKHKR
jgi:hypothetical protein